MERFGSGCAELQQHREFLEQLLYPGRESGDDGGCLCAPGFNEEAILSLEKVRPEAVYKTCCIEGMMERPNSVRKSMSSKRVSVAAKKNSNLKFCSETDRKLVKSKPG
jgi:hypothetical protein